MAFKKGEGMQKNIDKFFTSSAYGVVGASNNRSKYGNKVLRVYLQNNKKVYPVNPNEEKIEELEVIKSVRELPDIVKSISIITPPNVTEKVVDEAIAKGIENIWMQPGAENEKSIEKCKQHNINVIAGGPCVLVTLRFKED